MDNSDDSWNILRDNLGLWASVNSIDVEVFLLVADLVNSIDGDARAESERNHASLINVGDSDVESGQSVLNDKLIWLWLVKSLKEVRDFSTVSS